ncbi:MAG: type II toxin-antitoxin system Phd/YefM family antitoxin [Opitutales bacterium]
MKTVTIMEAQHNLSKVLRSMGSSGRVAITRNKKIVAELAPPREALPPIFPDFSARASATWGEAWKGASTQDLIDDARGER